jgi:hypothetical protein
MSRTQRIVPLPSALNFFAAINLEAGGKMAFMLS